MKKTAHTILKAVTCLGLSLHFAVAFAMLPEGGVVQAGQANIQTSENALIVQQASDKAVINWTNFNVGAGQSAQFIVPNSMSATLNRVTGADISQILGSL